MDGGKVLNFLLDTHILIWLATDPGRLSPALISALESADERYVSVVSALEIQLKHSKSPSAFPFSLDEMEQSIEKFGCIKIPLTFDDIRTVGHMRFLHNDPFDKLLMAQASIRPVYLASLDQKIKETYEMDKAFYFFDTKARQ